MNQPPKKQNEFRMNSKSYLRYCLLAASITLLVHLLAGALVENLKLENAILDSNSDCETSTEFNSKIQISDAEMFSGSLPSKPDQSIVRHYIKQKCYKSAERFLLTVAHGGTLRLIKNIE